MVWLSVMECFLFVEIFISELRIVYSVVIFFRNTCFQRFSYFF